MDRPAGSTIAYRVATPRLVLRCWEPRDAPLLDDAIVSSLDHLRPWMPWARAEPVGLDRRVEMLRGFRAKFDSDTDHIYGVFTADEARVLGGTGLHPRVGPRAAEIGYWIRADAAGQGFAREATAAMTRAGFELHGLERIEIHCDPANRRSAAIPERLGYRHDATLRHRGFTAEGERREQMIWSMLREECPRSSAAELPIRAWDAAGRELSAPGEAPRERQPEP